jgi:hypothetical protein
MSIADANEWRNRLAKYERKEIDDHMSYVTKSTGISGIIDIQSRKTFSADMRST